MTITGANRVPISIIVPAFNEGESLPLLCSGIRIALETACVPFEIIFVDDGSTDTTWCEIHKLSIEDPRIHGVRFRKNAGKAAALRAGFNQAKGETLVTLDADLQDDPAEIPRLLGLLDSGYDVVVGWKRIRNDPWHKRWSSKLFNLCIRSISGVKVHDNNCGLKGLRKHVVQELPLWGDLHRFIPMLAHDRGFSVTEIEVRHHSRRFGKSKYGLRRSFGAAFDIVLVRFMVNFQHQPLRGIAFLAMLPFLCGLIGLVYLAVLWCIGERPIGNRPLLGYSIAALLFGAQLLTLGILAELILWRSIPLSTDFSIVDRTSKRDYAFTACD